METTTPRHQTLIQSHLASSDMFLSIRELVFHVQGQGWESFGKFTTPGEHVWGVGTHCTPLSLRHYGRDTFCRELYYSREVGCFFLQLENKFPSISRLYESKQATKGSRAVIIASCKITAGKTNTANVAMLSLRASWEKKSLDIQYQHLNLCCQWAERAWQRNTSWKGIYEQRQFLI